MKLSIIPADNSAAVDGEWILNMDLSSASIPSNIQALHFDDSTNSGHIEYTELVDNLDITSLPDWATATKTIWEDAKEAIENPVYTDEQKVALNKMHAQALLEQCDWTQLADVNLTDANLAEWNTYRSALRAIIQNATVDPTWPTEPSVVWAD